jgi:hypothetical protein
MVLVESQCDELGSVAYCSSMVALKSIAVADVDYFQSTLNQAP